MRRNFADGIIMIPRYPISEKKITNYIFLTTSCLLTINLVGSYDGIIFILPCKREANSTNHIYLFPDLFTLHNFEKIGNPISKYNFID